MCLSSVDVHQGPEAFRLGSFPVSAGEIVATGTSYLDDSWNTCLVFLAIAHSHASWTVRHDLLMLKART